MINPVHVIRHRFASETAMSGVFTDSGIEKSTPDRFQPLPLIVGETGDNIQIPAQQEDIAVAARLEQTEKIIKTGQGNRDESHPAKIAVLLVKPAADDDLPTGKAVHPWLRNKQAEGGVVALPGEIGLIAMVAGVVPATIWSSGRAVTVGFYKQKTLWLVGVIP